MDRSAIEANAMLERLEAEFVAHGLTIDVPNRTNVVIRANARTLKRRIGDIFDYIELHESRAFSFDTYFSDVVIPPNTPRDDANACISAAFQEVRRRTIELHPHNTRFRLNQLLTYVRGRCEVTPYVSLAFVYNVVSTPDDRAYVVKRKRVSRRHEERTDATCMACLEPNDDGEMIWLGNAHLHTRRFHCACVLEWWRMNGNAGKCPVCRDDT